MGRQSPSPHELLRNLDRGHMLKLVASFPAQMKDGWGLGTDFARSLKKVRFDKVVVCGMGGSAIGADLIGSYLGDRLQVPLFVNRHYELTRALSTDALLVVSSYSGNTGETINSYKAGKEHSAGVVGITSGGKLEKILAEDGAPVCKIPGGMPPRAAIAYSFFPLVQILRSMGAADVDDGEYAEAVGTLERVSSQYASDSSENFAVELAHRLVGRLPFVYSCGGLTAPVARRWCTQINENSKQLAHHAAFPELNHNEIMGWKAVEPVRKKIVIVYLEDYEDHDLVRKQAEICLDIIAPYCSDIIRVSTMPGGRMARGLAVMILGDFLSVYLAGLNGVDPTPVANIDAVKQRLGESTR